MPGSWRQAAATAHRSRRCLRQSRGFTLPEVLIAATVLAFAVAALTQAIVAGQVQTHDAMHRTRAILLAEAMLDEVLSKPYDDPDGETSPGPEDGESKRTQFDNVDDYHGFTEMTGRVTDHAGNAYPDAYDRFQRSVTVKEKTVKIEPFDDRKGMMVTVTVRDQRDGQWTVSRFVPEPAS